MYNTSSVLSHITTDLIFQCKLKDVEKDEKMT